MGGIVKKILIPAIIVGLTVFTGGSLGLISVPFFTTAGAAALGAAALTALASTLSLVAAFLIKPSQDMGSVLSRQQTRLNQAALGKWVFGKTNAPLDLVFEDKGSNRYVTQVLHLASHEINAVLELHINDELAINAAGTLQAPWTTILRRFENLGTAAQLALVMSNSAWPAAAKGQELAHIGLEWDFKNGQEKISGGVPTRLTQVVEGCMVYDPRLDTTVGGTGPHRGNDQTTWEYINAGTDIGENWALLVAFYLLGWQINGKLVIGMGVDPADIDTDQLIDAANVCEQTVDAKKRYKIGGVLQTDGNHQRVLKELESAIGGKISKIGGKWFIWAPNDDLTSLETITDDDLVADVPQVFRPAGPLADRFNGARGRFVNAANQYQPEFYPDVNEPTAVTEDGRIHVKEHDFAMIQDVSIAERVARMMVRRSRFAGTFKYVLWFTAIRFQPFDVITVNGRDTNDLNVLVRITNMGIAPAGIVVLELLEENSSIYNTSDPLGTPLTQQDPDAFDPTAKIPLTGLVATPITLTGDDGSKTDAFDVTWDTVGGLVKETEVQFAISAVVLWQPVASSSRDFDNAIIAPVEPGTNYNIRARHITITGVVGDFVTLTNQLAGSDGTGAIVFYIKPLNGTAIHNGTGTLTIEAHKITNGVDALLSAGTIKLFDPSNLEVTVANGYATGSDGFTGVLDSGDISGAKIITMKDGTAGTPLDTVSLVDIADGGDATHGFIEPSLTLAWSQAPNSGAWTPSTLTSDLDCTFVRGGVAVARIARRVTLASGTGNLTISTVVHKGTDLNIGDVAVVVSGNGSTAVTVQFDYDDGAGNKTSVAETSSSAEGGDDGASSHGVLVNGGFETGDNTGWSVRPTGVIINDGTARTGTYYMRLASGAGGPNHISDRYAAPAVGREVRLSGFARRDESDLPDNATDIAVRFWDSSDVQVGTRPAVGTADKTIADWQALSGTAVVPATTVTFSFDCGESEGVGAWEFDDLSAIVEGDPSVFFYIKPITGTAIQNGVGTLTIEAHKVAGGLDLLLSAGTIQLFEGSTLVTFANGYVTGSDGYTGILDSGDISGSAIIELKDGAAGAILDSITLVDIADGGDATHGFIEPSLTLAWSQAPNSGTWTPSTLISDLDCTFVRGGAVVARIARRITLTSGTGNLAATVTTHKDPGGDLNIGDVTVILSGNNTTALTVQFDYDDGGGNTSSVAETSSSAQGGDDGSTGATGDTGPTGSDGIDGITIEIKPTQFAVSADSAGVVVTAGLTGSLTTIKFFEGDTALTHVTAALAQGEFRITGRTFSPTGFAGGAKTGGGTDTANFAVIGSWSDTTAVIGHIDYAISFKRLAGTTVETLTLRQPISIVRAGGVGEGVDAVTLKSVSANAGTGTTTQQLRVHTDGTVDASTLTSGVYTDQYAWLNSGVNSDYDVKMVKVSGAGLTSGTLDSWLNCGTINEWKRTAAGLKFTGQLSIRDAATGIVLDSAIVELDNITV